MATVSELVVAAVSGSGIGTVATAGVNWLTRRGKDQAYAKGLVDRAMENALKGVSDQLARADDRIQGLEDQHTHCTEQLTSVKARLDVSEAERAELRREIGRLMDEAVPGYRPRIAGGTP
jgi:septal ring factor EnvC (AmiA/AmiB activator)